MASLNPPTSYGLISLFTISSGLRFESPAPAARTALPYDSMVSPLRGLLPMNAQRASLSAACLSRGVVVGDVKIRVSDRSPARSAPANAGGMESPASAVCSQTRVDVDPTISTVKRIGVWVYGLPRQW